LFDCVQAYTLTQTTFSVGVNAITEKINVRKTNISVSFKHVIKFEINEKSTTKLNKKGSYFETLPVAAQKII